MFATHIWGAKIGQTLIPQLQANDTEKWPILAKPLIDDVIDCTGPGEKRSSSWKYIQVTGHTAMNINHVKALVPATAWLPHTLVIDLCAPVCVFAPLFRTATQWTREMQIGKVFGQKIQALRISN